MLKINPTLFKYPKKVFQPWHQFVLNKFYWNFFRKNERTEDIESEDGEEEDDEDDDEALDAATELMYRWSILTTK